MGDEPLSGTPIPIRRAHSVDPSWTAPVTASSASVLTSAQPTAPASLPGPAPLASPAVAAALAGSTGAAEAVVLPATVSVVQSTTNQPLPPPAAAEPSAQSLAPAELDLGDDASPQRPWQLIVMSSLSVLLIVGLVAGLWWFGFIFGPPRDPQSAAVKALAALEAVGAYHLEGTGSLTLDPGTTPAGTGPFQLNRAGTIGLLVRGDRGADAAVTRLTIDLSQSSLTLPTLIPNSLEATVVRTDDQVLLQLPLMSLLAGAQADEWLALSDVTADEAVSTAPAVPTGERVGVDRLGTVRTVRYRYRLSRDHITALLPLLGALPAETMIGTGATVDADLWVGVRDFLPYQLQLRVHEQRPAVALEAEWLFVLSKFGKPASVAVPDATQVRPATLASLIPDNLASLTIVARDTQRKADLALLLSALENYRAQQGSYPSTNGVLVKISDPQSNLATLVGPYLKELPTDPSGDAAWYGYTSTGQTIELSAVLESPTDPSGVNRGGRLLFLVTQTGNAHAPAAANEAVAPLAPTPTTPAPTGGSGRLPGN